MCTRITVFTPTYNRERTLYTLYISLCAQTFSGFEWLIVDDGSVDNTEELVERFASESKIAIRYVKRENGGKHRAINQGVREAQGELFFIVDSDDFLVDNALERVWFHFCCVRNDSRFAGVSGMRMYPNGEKIGGEEDWTIIDAFPSDVQRKYNLRGDRAEVWRTDVLRQFPFPEFEGETFCGEALVWHRIGRAGYKLRFFYEKIYVGEYLSDGLTKNLRRSLERGPRAALLGAYEFFGELDWFNDFFLKMKRGGTWWERVFQRKKIEQETFIGIGNAIFTFPAGVLMWLWHQI